MNGKTIKNFLRDNGGEEAPEEKDLVGERRLELEKEEMAKDESF